MTKEELKKQIENFTVPMKDNFKNSKELVPMLFIFAERNNKERGVLMCPMLRAETSEDKQNFFQVVGREMMRNKDITHIDGILFISEAWSARLSKEETEAWQKNPVPVSQMKNKFEIVTMMGMTDNYETTGLIFEIKKDGDKKDLVLAEDLNKSDNVESNLLMNFWRGAGTIK